MKLVIVLTLLACSAVQANQAEINSIEQASMQMDNKQLILLTHKNTGYEQALAYYRLAIIQDIHNKAERAKKSLESLMLVF